MWCYPKQQDQTNTSNITDKMFMSISIGMPIPNFSAITLCVSKHAKFLANFCIQHSNKIRVLKLPYWSSFRYQTKQIDLSQTLVELGTLVFFLIMSCTYYWLSKHGHFHINSNRNCWWIPISVIVNSELLIPKMSAKSACKKTIICASYSG